MTTKNKTIDSFQYSAFWRSRLDKQTLVLESIISLLKKYGSCLDLHSLHREFLLTMMGQYFTGDACYYSVADSSTTLQPAVVYGSVPISSLHGIDMNHPLIEKLKSEKTVQHFAKLPDDVFTTETLKTLQTAMEIASPIYLRETLIGVVLLGKRISKREYSEQDLKLLHTLCAASAVTFNNARLYENVKTSMDEVQRLADLRNEMLDRIGHEFRTPLTTITSVVQVLSDVPESISGTLAEAVSRLNELTESLLELRSMASPDLTSSDAFDAVSIIHEYVSGHSRQAAAKGLVFEIKEVSKLGPLCIGIARTAFATIVEKLLDNAIQFSEPNSSIGIDLEIARREPDEALDGTLIADWRDQTRKTLAEYRSLIETTDETSGDSNVHTDNNPGSRGQQHRRRSTDRTGPYYVLRVTDTGIGIPEDELPFIGEPFRQASNSPDRNVKGKALGLALVQKALSEVRGHLCCQSVEGVTTTFSVFLPTVGNQRNI